MHNIMDVRGNIVREGSRITLHGREMTVTHVFLDTPTRIRAYANLDNGAQLVIWDNDLPYVCIKPPLKVWTVRDKCNTK